MLISQKTSNVAAAYQLPQQGFCTGGTANESNLREVIPFLRAWQFFVSSIRKWPYTYEMDIQISMSISSEAPTFLPILWFITSRVVSWRLPRESLFWSQRELSYIFFESRFFSPLKTMPIIIIIINSHNLLGKLVPQDLYWWQQLFCCPSCPPNVEWHH